MLMYTNLWVILFIQLLVFEDLEVPTHKTKNIVNYYSQMEDTKKLLLVDGTIDEKLKLSTQNLHYVNVLPSIVSFNFIHVASIIVQMELYIVNFIWNLCYASGSQNIYQALYLVGSGTWINNQ